MDIISHSYYGEDSVREICHAVKQTENSALQKEAVKIISEDLISRKMVRPHDYLIPAPNHSGKAEYTLGIAEKVARRTGSEVLDIFTCVPHFPLYDDRKQALILAPKSDIQSLKLKKASRLFFVDNVISTGKTFLEAQKLIPKLIPLVYAVDDTKHIDLGFNFITDPNSAKRCIKKLEAAFVK